jgi:hypothetical protein
MNLWDKASRSALLVVVCSLFFSACEEELNNVGKDITGNKFELLFKEFTLPSRVIIDSLNTSENGLLTGSYVDPEFGTVTSEACSSFSGVVPVDFSGSNIVFDSLNLKIRLTPYYYGDKSPSIVSISVHELSEEITDISGKTNLSNTSYKVDPFGEVSYVFLPDKHEAIDDTTILSVELPDSYFQKMQEFLALIKKDTTIAEYTADDISANLGFYGFAIIADGNKVIGISDSSYMSMIYHIVDGGVHQGPQEYRYYFKSERYNKITSDRAGTAISGLDDANPSNPVFPENNLRYIQSGTGVTTEIDFQPFLDFFKDTPTIIFNSVGLSFGEIESIENFAAPTGFVLNQTNEDSEATSIDVNGSLYTSVLSDKGVISRSGEQQLFPLVIDTLRSNTGSYIGLPTSYFQLLKSSEVERSTAVMLPVSTTIGNNSGYTVDRLVIHQDSIKLKVYYTIPK